MKSKNRRKKARNTQEYSSEQQDVNETKKYSGVDFNLFRAAVAEIFDGRLVLIRSPRLLKSSAKSTLETVKSTGS